MVIHIIGNLIKEIVAYRKEQALLQILRPICAGAGKISEPMRESLAWLFSLQSSIEKLACQASFECTLNLLMSEKTGDGLCLL